jgi:hypothetical protein
MMRTANSNGIRRLGDPRDVSMFKFELEREGVVKFKPIYEAIYLFLKDNGYEHPKGGDKIEDLYWERWVQSGHKEQHIWWRAKKDATPYIRYLIEINFQTLLGSPSEIAHNGKKVKGEFMDLIIRVECLLQWDMDNKLEDGIFQNFKNLFFSKLYKDELNFHKGEVAKMGQNLQKVIKHMLDMHNDESGIEVNWNPQLGYKA